MRKNLRICSIKIQRKGLSNFKQKSIWELSDVKKKKSHLVDIKRKSLGFLKESTIKLCQERFPESNERRQLYCRGQGLEGLQDFVCSSPEKWLFDRCTKQERFLRWINQCYSETSLRITALCRLLPETVGFLVPRTFLVQLGRYTLPL